MTSEEAKILALARLRAALTSGRAQSIRKSAGLSQTEVGQGVGVSPSTVSTWESGLRKPKGDAAMRYGHLLDLLEAEIEGRVS